MELVTEDGNVIELKEGEKHELGRCSGFDVERDKSVSRLHVIVELLRPASRKGKEVVGKSSGLKLHVRVVGRNPICITSSQGLGDSVSSRIKFAVKGETGWLAPGDKFTLSIRRPLFFVLRQCLRGSFGGNEMVDSRSAGRTPQPPENHLNSLAQKNVIEVESNSLEEEGIATAVARRQRRRLEREVQQRMRLSEQRQAGNGGVEDPDRVKPDSENHEKESVVPHQTNLVYPVNPVSEFGFIVKGSEFQAYDMRSISQNGLAWNWSIDKKGATEVDSSKAPDGESKINIRNSVKISRLEEEDEEWEGDNEERLSETKPKTKSDVSTRSSILVPQAFNKQFRNRSIRRLKDDEGLIEFSIEDNDSKEEGREDGNEWIDVDDEAVSHQNDRRPSNEGKEKAPCKYGSKCYSGSPGRMSSIYQNSLIHGDELVMLNFGRQLRKIDLVLLKSWLGGTYNGTAFEF